MGEQFSAVFPSDRALEQAIVGLKKGAHILKYGRRGKPKLCPFRLSTDEKSLIWYSGKEEKQLRLSSVTSIIRGQRTVNFQKRPQPERECQSFSLIYGNGEFSLDLTCKDKTQADSWYLGLKALISSYHHPRPMSTYENRKGSQSCANSPASFIRRKYYLGLLDKTPKISQPQKSVYRSPSPTQSFSERCFSDGLSCSSDSFYSESSLSLSSNSPNFEPEDPKKHPKMLSRFVMPKSKKPVLRDVLIWGEGVEGGLLGGGYKNGTHLDALLPKFLESISTLDVQNISLGGKHAALVTKQGDVFCWGEGKGGRLGHKVNMDINCPKQVESLNGVHINSVSCGEYQSCALSLSGELYMWGNNCNYGVPRRVVGILDGVSILNIACGEWHTAIVSKSGQLFTFGDGTFGVLGHGDCLTVSQPKQVESLKGISVNSVACGPWHTAAIVGTGKLFTWGDGDKGRLGHANQERKLLPTCVNQLVDHEFVQVSCGRMLTVGLTNTGTVYTMGSSVHGQLGNPHSRDKSINIVQGKLKFEFVRKIASGSYHIAVLTSTGNVYTWGRGFNGQLGLGDMEDRNSPTLVEALREREVESISCGSSSTAAICLHKSVSCIDQSACRGCRIGFSFMRKKHNCYNCGLLFCNLCSSKKIKNASLAPNESKPFRVCDMCFERLERNEISLLGNLSPRQLLLTQKPFYDENEDLAVATPKWSKNKMMSVKNYSTDNNSQSIDSNSLLLGGLPRWGEVSSPASFRKHRRGHSMSYIPVQSKCTASERRERDLAESDKILAEEVEKLRAQAQNLEKLCERRGYKLQSCQQRIEETWSLAKKDTVKCKAAKEVIKALTSRLHIMSPKVSAGKEAKVQVGTNLPLLISTCTNSPTVNGMRSIFSATHISPEIGQMEDRKVDSLCSSPLVFSDNIRTVQDRNLENGETTSAEEPCARKTDSGQDKVREKHEWMEQYQPGVYITFLTLPSGQKGLKRVRFSRKSFTEKEAESWWEENELEVYQKYDIDGYINSNQDTIRC